MTYAQQHLAEARRILDQLDLAAIERLAARLADLRTRGGRLFCLGVGGSAARLREEIRGGLASDMDDARRRIRERLNPPRGGG